ncbi:MAG TPA: hypothetical protein VHQ22_15495 [Terriglobales bacterium]|jgi:hypothetical protein|nr:hypothetical protein [Terriglobales bacterium]
MGSQERRLCWVAGSAGLAALSGVATTILFLPFPIMLMLGAAVTARWPRAGRALMWVSATVLSAFLWPGFVVLLREFHFEYVDFNVLLIDIGWIGTLILLPLCDVMLAVDRYHNRALEVE